MSPTELQLLREIADGPTPPEHVVLSIATLRALLARGDVAERKP